MLLARKSSIAWRIADGHVAQFPRRQDFDSISPLIKEPGHFQPASSMKSYDETAVVFVLEGLGWMETELSSSGRGFGRKAPHDFTELRSVLIGAKCPGRIVVQRKISLEGEAFVEAVGFDDPIHAEIQEVLAAIWLARDQIAPGPQKQSVRLDRTRLRIRGAVYDPQPERAAQSFDNRVDDLRRQQNARAGPHDMAQRAQNGFDIRFGSVRIP